MINFSCSQCSEKLEAPTSMEGEILQCPKCKYPEKIPPSNEPLKIFIDDSNDERPAATEDVQFRPFNDAADKSSQHSDKYKRPLTTGATATRVRTFHSRLSENAMNYMDELINEWLDGDPNITVKFSTSTVGVVEGKKTESHLIVSVWY